MFRRGILQSTQLLNWLSVVYLAAVAAVTFQAVLLSGNTLNSDGVAYTKYNNYVIFKNSYYHLLEGKNLYVYYLNEYWDLYKYSPTFSMCFAPFALLPDSVGLLMWNALNAFVLLYGVRGLPCLSINKKNLLVILLLPELITSMQNSQSNALLAGLVILSFTHAENKNHLTASLFLVLSVFVKIYCGVAVLIFLLFSDRLKLMIYLVFFTLVLFFLPLPLIGFNELLFQYKNWWTMLLEDRSSSVGMSALGIASIFITNPNIKTIVSLVGLVSLVLPLFILLRGNRVIDRMYLLGYVLVWIVIFNHKAESPTFIIALAGALLYLIMRKESIVKWILIAFTLLVGSLSVTDVLSHFYDKKLIYQYHIKALPYMVVWAIMLVHFFRYKQEESDSGTPQTQP